MIDLKLFRAATSWGLLLLVLPSVVGGNEGDSLSSTTPQEGEDPRTVVTDEIEVKDESSIVPLVRTLSGDDLPQEPIGDGADLLRGVPGISVGRMGGHGLEPRIRGLGEGSLNVQVDGAFVHGGCPNRMDPPTSFAAPDAFDEVTIVRGVQSLRFGPGGTAGTVLFERSAPAFDHSTGWRGEASSSYGSWHRQPELSFDGSLGVRHFVLRAQGGVRSFGSYEDGDGATVRSAFESRHANLMLGFGDLHSGQAQLGFETVRTDDALFAGAGMDSPSDAADTVRLRFRRDEPWLGLARLQADAYYSTVEHLMDNYSLRPLTAPMAMRVPSTSDTYGARLNANRTVSERLFLSFGVEVQANRREALRFAGPNPDTVDILQSALWPAAALDQGGVFLEAVQGLGTQSRLVAGVRVDRFASEAGKADLKPTGMNRSPNQLYTQYYGSRADDWVADEWGGLLRFEHLVSSGQTLFAGLSRSSRAADATERYLAGNNMVPTRRWVGNPLLVPAKHHQLDLGLSSRSPLASWSVVGFIDQVDDFILRDRARGQAGILSSDGATIYRNVEARLVGAELEGDQRLGSRWQLAGTASWVRGDNRTDGRPLAQIPPLMGWLQLDYRVERWTLAGRVRWADAQDRVDDDPATGSGQDYGPTAGYAVLDLSCSLRPLESLSLWFGVDNTFDRTYADHLNRGNLFDPDPVRINEPGRSLWVRVVWRGGA